MKNAMNKVFINNLQSILDSKHIDRKELAKGSGIPYATLACWFAGQRFPRKDGLAKLANYLGVPVSALVSDVPEDTTSAGFLRALFSDDPEMLSILDKAAVDINGLPYGAEVPANIKAILRNALLLAAEEVKKIKAEG